MDDKMDPSKPMRVGDAIWVLDIDSYVGLLAGISMGGWVDGWGRGLGGRVGLLSYTVYSTLLTHL